MQYDLTIIEGYRNWKSKTELKKGWSTDKKFLIETVVGERFLLRLSEKFSLSSEKLLYDLVEKLSNASINCSCLLASGLCNKEQHTYRLFTWVEGEELLDHIEEKTVNEQYQLGLDAGRILKKIHEQKNTLAKRRWSEYFSRKIDRNITNFKTAGEEFIGSEQVISFLNNNRQLLLNRPQCLHHGDYHLGNMLIDKEERLGVIDFNRLDYGDPWEEFNRMPWNATVSPYFSNGLLHGYFKEEPDEYFFRLMCLYIGSNQLGAFAWGVHYGAEELKVIKVQTDQVMSWYNGFTKVIPDWYKTKKEMSSILNTVA